jgi:hypothetical protein
MGRERGNGKITEQLWLVELRDWSFGRQKPGISFIDEQAVVLYFNGSDRRYSLVCFRCINRKALEYIWCVRVRLPKSL